MIRKIKKQFLNSKLIVKTMLIVILFYGCTTSIAYASNENVKLKKQEVTKKMYANEEIINIEQLSINKKLPKNEFEKLAFKEEKTENKKIGEISNCSKSVTTKKLQELNGNKTIMEVKTLTKETDKYLSEKVEGITPKIEKMSTTAYCACTKCCGKSDGLTASEEKAIEWYTVAAGNCYKFGTIMYIPELADKPNGGWFVVQDRGSAISDENLDIFLKNHEIATVFGRHEFEVYVYEF